MLQVIVYIVIVCRVNLQTKKKKGVRISNFIEML